MIRFSLHHPVAVFMAYLAVALLGVAAWQHVPLELLPDTRLPRLSVTASWPGASPETTEAFLTSPLEAAIQQVRGVAKVESTSEEVNGTGRASIDVEFTRDTDMDFARLELSERLAALADELPEAASHPAVEQYIPEALREQSRPFLRYTISGPYTADALRQHVDEVIAPELRQVEGVAEVTGQGGRERLLRIELDPARALALGLDPEEVRRRIENLDEVREAGVVQRGGIRYTVAIRSGPVSAADVRRLPVLTNRNRILRLEDVATVQDTRAEALFHYRIDGLPAVSFEVHREVGTNAVAVADRVKARLDSIASLHPRGVRLILDADESAAIRTQLSDLKVRAISAAVVVFLVLLLFLRSLRSSAIIFATIAFSVLITLNLVYFSGFTLNVLTLMGIAMGFGLMVDNAIVVLENIYRRRRLGEPAHAAAERGAREVILPVLAATLTTVVVFLPFVYLQGEMRLYYIPLAVVVGFGLLASLFVSFTFIPALAGRALRGSSFGSPVAESAQLDDVGFLPTHRPVYVRLYTALIGVSLRRPWVPIMLALLALGGSYYLFNRYVTQGVIWRPWWSEESYIDIDIGLPRGEELQHTDALARHFEERLRAMPGVERFTSTVYPQSARIRVSFPDSLQRTSVPLVTKEQLESYSHLFGGADVRVYGYGPSFYGGGGSPPNYSVQVLGYNYEAVRAIADDLAKRLQHFARIRDVDTNSTGQWFTPDKATEVVLRIDRARLAMHALTARAVVNRVAAAAGGESRPDPLHMEGEELGVAVRLAGHDRLDLAHLRRLLIPTPGGEAVRLGEVATVQERDVPAQILREDQQYQRTVAYQFLGPVKLGDKVRDAVVAATELAPGYTLVTRQDWSWSADEQRQVYGVLAISLLLVFMVTAALFESLRQPFCVLLTVPMALIGVFLIFFCTDASFTREALIGVIMMGGIVVNNAILLVDHINQLRQDGTALREAITRGTIERVRPILMTSATTILGLLPLVLFSQSADANIWNALGLSLLGGLASSTVLVLTVTPALYLLLERRTERSAVVGPELSRVRMPMAGPADSI